MEIIAALVVQSGWPSRTSIYGGVANVDGSRGDARDVLASHPGVEEETCRLVRGAQEENPPRLCAHWKEGSKGVVVKKARLVRDDRVCRQTARLIGRGHDDDPAPVSRVRSDTT